MTPHIKLDDDVRDVLERSAITDTQLVLPDQLERKLYERVNKVIVAAGGKWLRKAKAHVFTRDPRQVLGLALANGQITDTKKLHNQFFTPPDLAARMCQMALVRPAKMVLEPSAGAGALVDAAIQAGGKVTAIEIDLDLVSRELIKFPIEHLVTVDFLELTTKHLPAFDCVVMNPPFANNADIKHVTHAFEFLRQHSFGQGRLVAVMSPHFTFAEDKPSKQFRKLVNTHGVYEKLPEDTFRGAGTSVNTVLVTLERN